MFRNFIKKNSSSILFVGILLLIWGVLYLIRIGDDKTNDYFKNPKVNDIYILKEGNIYAPMRLDSLSKNQYFMRDYLFHFEDAIPEQNQILQAEFDQNFYAIYEKKEIDRLIDSEIIIKIYR